MIIWQVDEYYSVYNFNKLKGHKYSLGQGGQYVDYNPPPVVILFIDVHIICFTWKFYIS